MTSNVALKEWALVVQAMASGRQLLLVRKGGIRDPRGAFQLAHREFFLYPTLEHQSPEAVRPEFQNEFRESPSPPGDSDQVALSVYGGVAFCAQVREPAQLAGLEKYHIWKPEFFEERMIYRPQSPTLVVVLRAYRLPSPHVIPVESSYAGCKSWVPLSRTLSLQGISPVVENRRFREALEEISAKIS
ncbi:MAG: DUF1802 family protein [Candidatus Omnitrophica bacterium]|nr:DUF1802 family protein [Candidatus Omnitrophota bacterium]